MRSVLLYFLLVILSFSVIQSCIHHPEEIIPLPKHIDTTKHDTTIKNQRPCNPDTVYYMRDIQPIFNTYCVSTDCHGGTNPKEGLNLSTYSTAANNDKVKPYNASNSKLYRSVTGSADIMPPPPKSKLSQNEIDLIKKWINQGAKDLWCDDMYGPCDTTAVKYSTTISGILNTNCVSCHSGATPSGAVTLNTYTGVKTVIDNGKLWNAVNHLSGPAKAMPNSTTFLNKCNLRQIKIWIDSGAPQN